LVVGIRVNKAFIILQVVAVPILELFLVVEENKRVFSVFLGVVYAPVVDD
jgi:hypothetical protein